MGVNKCWIEPTRFDERCDSENQARDYTFWRVVTCGIKRNNFIPCYCCYLPISIGIGKVESTVILCPLHNKAKQGFWAPASPYYLLTHRIKLKGKLLFCRTNSEHLGPAHGTHALGCRFPILHGYGPGVFHFPFGTAFHTVCLHQFTSIFVWRIYLLLMLCQYLLPSRFLSAPIGLLKYVYNALKPRLIK